MCSWGLFPMVFVTWAFKTQFTHSRHGVGAGVLVVTFQLVAPSHRAGPNVQQPGCSPHSPAWSLGAEGAGGEKGWGVGRMVVVVSQPCFSKPGNGLQGKCVWENPKRKQIVKDKGRVPPCRQINQGQVKGGGECRLLECLVNPPDSGFLKGETGVSRRGVEKRENGMETPRISTFEC